MKKINLTPETKINAILLVDFKTLNVTMSKDMNMTLLEWIMKYSFSNESLEFGPLPNLLDMTFDYAGDGSNGIHKMSAYLFEDSNYRVFVNIFDEDLVVSNP
jgi:hypothetical protein